MLVKKSRYKNARLFTPDADGKRIFSGLRARDIDTATGVIEHEILEGDRLDLLAIHYYNDDRMWWRIIDANPEVVFSQFALDKAMAGKVLLIPKLKE